MSRDSAGFLGCGRDERGSLGGGNNDILLSVNTRAPTDAKGQELILDDLPNAKALPKTNRHFTPDFSYFTAQVPR